MLVSQLVVTIYNVIDERFGDCLLFATLTTLDNNL